MKSACSPNFVPTYRGLPENYPNIWWSKRYSKLASPNFPYERPCSCFTPPPRHFTRNRVACLSVKFETFCSKRLIICVGKAYSLCRRNLTAAAQPFKQFYDAQSEFLERLSSGRTTTIIPDHVWLVKVRVS